MNQVLARQFQPRGRAPVRLSAQPQQVLSDMGKPDGEALMLGAPHALQGENPFASFLKAQPYGVLRQDRQSNLGASDAVPPSEGGPRTVEEWVAVVGPIAREVLASSATQDVEVLKAKIANQTRMAQVSPEPLRTLYLNNINVLKAKLRAAVQAREVERESQQATRTWRLAGYTVTGTGVAVGAGIIVALLALASKWSSEGQAARRKAS